MTLHEIIEDLEYELLLDPRPNPDILLSREMVREIVKKLRLMKKREMRKAMEKLR